jgi:NADPH2:quinone reductase
MKAAYIHKPGPAESIVYGELPKPTPGDGQVLVKIDAADINPIDTYVRSGMVAAPLPDPYILGSDLAGIVESVGPGVKLYKPGDRVWGTNQGRGGRQGTLAEYAAVDEKWLYPIPQGITSEAAVAISLVGITAYYGLVTIARLRSGEIVFVNGGTGGVGAAVVQIGKALGAKVIATAGSAEKVKRCRELGADLALNYKTDDVDARIKEFAPQGIGLWWETLREPNFDRTIGLLATRGRMVVMAGRDARPPFPVGPFYVKGCTLHGVALFNATAAEQGAAAEDINRWMVEGKLKANIDRVLPLADAAAAHRLQEDNTIHKAGTLAGKIVLKP